jgi:4-hydroxybenzoate polyprenyltransferase
VVFDQVYLPVLLIPAGPFYIGWVLATGKLLPSDLDFLLALLSILPFLGLGTILVNDAYDTWVDGLSSRKGMLASSTGRLSQGRLLALAGASFAVSVFLAALVSLRFLVVILALVVVALLYSLPPVQLSRRPGLDVAANAFGIGVLCQVAGWVLASPEPFPPVPWLVTSGLGTATFFLLPALMDYESDREGGKRTVATMLDWRGACLLGLAFIALADAGIVYMSLTSTILSPSFLWIAVPIIALQLSVFPILIRRRDLLRPMTTTMGVLLFIGNLAILLSFLGALGPF